MINTMDPAELYKRYTEQEDVYEAAAAIFGAAIAQLLQAAGIHPSSISARHKVPLELFKKQRKKRYTNPWLDCPDIVGARVIVTNHNEKSEVRRILETSDSLEVFETEDQATTADPATIAYRGLHLHARSGDVVNVNGTPIRCEIQIRTIAEHAWAETQHRFIYKKPIDVPTDIIRLFNRLLVLIELFDLELAKGVSAMQSLESYKALELSRHLEEILAAFTRTPSSLELTVETLGELSNAGLGSVDELRAIVDSFMEREQSSVKRLVSSYGPESDDFDVSVDWILTQGESLVFLALLQGSPDKFSNALHGSDLYPIVESLAIKTGNSAFIRH